MSLEYRRSSVNRISTQEGLYFVYPLENSMEMAAPLTDGRYLSLPCAPKQRRGPLGRPQSFDLWVPYMDPEAGGGVDAGSAESAPVSRFDGIFRKCALVL